MKVFIENESGSDKKNIFNEKTLEYKKTYKVSRIYPYPYGFILDTTSGDGDNLDCFIITNQQLKTGTFIDVEPIGLMEQFEDSKEDHKILAAIPGETPEITEEIKLKLKEFVEHVFDHLVEKRKKTIVGSFEGKERALELIEDLRDRI